MGVDKISLINKQEIEEVTTFLKKFDLKYDKNIDYTVIIRDNNKIIATASKEKNIVKCFAIDSSCQGEGLSTQLLTNIINKMFDEGFLNSKVFTKIENQELFKGMGYREIAHTDKVILMEMGNKSILKVLEKIKTNYNIDTNEKRAMLVMNCNPFTLGHQFLIEKVASENKEVLVFVVEEDRSIFPFKVRYELVKKGTAHLKNVKVIPGTDYLISSATFPNYFLKREDDHLAEYTKLDATICGEKFGKMLNINRRYVGDEPNCKVTNHYNEMLKNTLPKFGIEVIVIPRKKIDGKIISASYVRELLKSKNFEELKTLVPTTTFDFLTSSEGKEIGEKLRMQDSPC